jgi:SNF2 family DNA or RNA helicase
MKSSTDVRRSAVQVTLSGHRLLARFKFSVADNAQMESLGASFRKSDASWSMTLTLENCVRLREAFGDRLTIMPALREWAWAERQKRETLENLRVGELGDGHLANLRELTPELYKAVSSRSYQAVGAAFAITGNNILLGDQPGLGKTYMGLAAVVDSRAIRVLIISPRTAVRTVWESHIRRLAPHISTVVAQGPRDKRRKQIAEFRNRAAALAALPSTRQATALLINKEMIRVKRTYVCATGDKREFNRPPGRKGGCPHKDAHDHTPRYYPEYPELFGEPWDYIVMDESHHALASRYNIQSPDITQIRLGAMRLPLARDGRKLAMSGTPYRSKAQKAWGTLNWLQPKTFSSFWKWAGELFEVSEGAYARTVSETPRDPEMFADRMRPYLLARTKTEVAPELPPITYAGEPPKDNPDGPVAVWLDMDDRQARAYESMVKMAEATLCNGRITATGVLAELTRCRQFACSYAEATGRNSLVPSLPSNKYDWTLDFLREREGFPGKVIIASQFTSLLEVFEAALRKEGFEPLMLTGKTSDRGRKIFQDRIQDADDPHWIGMINMKAGGEAITLDQADDMITLDDPWTDDEIRQVEDRIHRISRIHNVTVYRLRSLGTIEQRIAEMTTKQRADLMALRPAGRKILSGLFK